MIVAATQVTAVAKGEYSQQSTMLRYLPEFSNFWNSPACRLLLKRWARAFLSLILPWSRIVFYVDCCGVGSFPEDSPKMHFRFSILMDSHFQANFPPG